MKTTMYFDSFSGAIDGMKRKDQGNAVKVLEVLSKHPRFSVFDATANSVIAKTMTYLFCEKYIAGTRPRLGYPRLGYPWMAVDITEKGQALLKGTPGVET